MHWSRSLLLCLVTTMIPACGGSTAGDGSRGVDTTGPFVIVAPLSLDHANANVGDTVAADVTFQNVGGQPLKIQRLVIAGRPPGGSHAGGPYDDFGPDLGCTSVQPGATVSLHATRTIAATDPAGQWEVYTTFEDEGGQYHDGPSVFFTVGAGGGTGGNGGSTGSGGSGGSGGTGGSGGGAGGGGTGPSAPGYFHTAGGSIVDSAGKVVRLTGLSWFGMETSNYAPHGLWTRSMDSMLDQVKSLGFNMIRIPYTNQMLLAGSTPNGIDFTQNPDLQGKTALQILDILVDKAGQRGLRIILDRHRPDSSAQSELWYTSTVSEQQWITDWTMLATRYKGNSTVIGCDLHNEPHGSATWGDGNMSTDWRLAAERAGNAILAVNPDLLIIVEGIERVGNDSYWWGGNLSQAASAPVRLSVANRLVYSPHDYPASVYNQPWFTAAGYPANLPSVWDAHWGALAKQKVAPIWIGEFGTKDQTTVDQQWLSSMVSYVSGNGLSFAFWCLNPDSGDTGGILQDDWQTVNTDKMTALKPALAPLL